MINRIFLAAVLLAITGPSFAANWTVPSKVSYVRTYDGVTFSIGLVDQQCENQKDYFQVSDRADNKTFYSIAYGAFLGDKRVRLSYTLSASGVHCVVDGIWVSD